ncbi:MAG: hypothetical protein LBD47_03245 [Treponema sp.]|jgi:hypothetical protein|nr:hypothetical protein [Treponema sp.]
MSGKRTFAAGAFLLGVLLVISCDDFYSATWGTAREYDASKISVNAGNVDEWVEKAAGNPELADAVTDAIKNELEKGSLNTGDKAKLQDAGVALAIEASGIGETILEKAADTLSNGISSVEDLSKLLADVQSDFKKNNGAKAASDIADIISGSLAQPSYGKDSVPKLTGAYVNAEDPADVGQAVVVLTLALVGKATDASKDMSAVNLSDFAAYGVYINVNKEAAVMADNPSSEAVTLAAYLNLIADDTTGKYNNNLLTGTIATAFGVL